MTKRRVLAAILIANACVFLVAWIVLLATRALGDDLLAPIQFPVIPIHHLAVELGSGVLTLAGAVGWWRGRRNAPNLLLFGLGMGCYAAINSLGWALANSVAAVVHMLFGAAVAVTTLVVLCSAPPQAAHGPGPSAGQ